MSKCLSSYLLQLISHRQSFFTNRKRLNDVQRLEIIQSLGLLNPPSKRQLASQYDVNEKTIRNVYLQRSVLMRRSERVSDNCRSKVFRARKAKYEDLEKKLYRWFESCRKINLPVPPQMLRVKALEIAKYSEIHDFSASHGWLRNFRNRHSLSSMSLFGEGDEVDKNNPVLLADIGRLKAEIDKFDAENVYNMNETGLFYRVIPRMTLVSGKVDRASLRGKKTPKDRVTLTVCCNATGSHKIPLQMIAKPKKPACIVGKEWPVEYECQHNAWMDKSTF